MEGKLPSGMMMKDNVQDSNFEYTWVNFLTYQYI